MLSAVRVSSMALRLLWIINIALGIYISYIATDATSKSWVLGHMINGLVIVLLLWFLGIAQGMTKTGSVGLALPIIGMAQPSIPDGAGLYIVQAIHVLLAIGAIALGEISAARYRKGIAATQAA